MTETTSLTIHAKPQYIGKLYGVELEIEAGGLYEIEENFNENTDEYEQIEPDIPRGWLREQEDSIEGVELISREPYSFETQVENIYRVFADIERQGFTPIRTPRGSTHVHANVADLTWDQLRYFIMACAWAEPALIELAGKGRKGNLFAQSYETTPLGWKPVIDWVRRGKFDQTWDTHYMAISFQPLTYLGSVEFRMGASARNAQEAVDWLSIIDMVVEAGRTLEITPDVEPEFLSALLDLADAKKRERLRSKGRHQAEEIWESMLEPWVEPEPRLRRKMGGVFPVNVEDYTIAIDQLLPSAAAYGLNSASLNGPTTGLNDVPDSTGCDLEDCEVCGTGIYATSPSHPAFPQEPPSPPPAFWSWDVNDDGKFYILGDDQ